MGSQIKFFKKSYCDRTQPNVSATASEASDIAEYALNRGNISAWVTTGSADANNTTWEVDWADERSVDSIFLIKHNFKSFKVEYWDGSAYQAFSPAIDETTNAADVTVYSVTSVDTTKVRITVRGTMVADSDKSMRQFIATKLLGQLNGWPVIKNPKVMKNLKSQKMLSGKANISENVGAFSCELQVKHYRNAADLTLVESLFRRTESFLVWLSGGDETQFFLALEGYRNQDIFLMKAANEYEPEFINGVYSNGTDFKMKLDEVTY